MTYWFYTCYTTITLSWLLKIIKGGDGMEMIKHIENIKKAYGKDAGVQIPNSLFKLLSTNIKNVNGSRNIQQVSFAYCYMVLSAFLYKYAHFVDLENDTYIQSSDIKELLGYGKTTKTIDRIIKKNGVLEEIGLIKTTKDYPVSFDIDTDEFINDIPIRTYTTIGKLSKEDEMYRIVKSVVKNRNYEIKEPLFLSNGFDCNENGTMYEYANTHKITIDELIKFISDDKLNNIDLMLYGYVKCKCKGFPNNTRNISLSKFESEMNIDLMVLYSHIKTLKGKKYIAVIHKGWKSSSKEAESNAYKWIGV